MRYSLNQIKTTLSHCFRPIQGAFSKKGLMILFGTLLLTGYILSVWFSIEPKTLDRNTLKSEPHVVGYATVTSLIETTQTLYQKPGGFLSNDVFPVTWMTDNMPAFEYGALEQIRDLSLVMRQEFSRSQSQSAESPQLATAQNKLNINHKSWAFPSAEGYYQDAVEALKTYRSQIMNPNTHKSQFYARADNLATWLVYVNARLGHLSQVLSASTAQKREDLSLAGESAAEQSTPRDAVLLEQTPWLLIDDNFYQARGACWALLNFMYAIEIDFARVLRDKNALISLRQIIRELESTQDTLWSPMVLNGTGFGIVANHSLVMANYISRANAAVIDLGQLLKRG